jgi:hypothetical protein
MHDLTKLKPQQWRAYLRHFYGEWPSIDEVVHIRRRNGVEPKWNAWSVKQSFDLAWNDHQKSERHHWQYWVLIEDDKPTPRALEMPYKTIKHMVADWIGATKAAGSDEPIEATQHWYLDRRYKIVLHARSRATVEYLLRLYTDMVAGDQVALAHYRKLETFYREKK